MPGRGGKRRENHQHKKLKGSDFFHVSGDFFMCKVIQFLENNKEVSCLAEAVSAAKTINTKSLKALIFFMFQEIFSCAKLFNFLKTTRKFHQMFLPKTLQRHG